MDKSFAMLCVKFVAMATVLIWVLSLVVGMYGANHNFVPAEARIVYFRDSRTGICFANVVCFSPLDSDIAAVPCEAVEGFLTSRPGD